jgi:hypothetical protein
VRVGVGVGVVPPKTPPQKPPATEKLPPDAVPAPGWPMVPPTVNCPPVEEPPPPAMAPHDRLKLPPTWA